MNASNKIRLGRILSSEMYNIKYRKCDLGQIRLSIQSAQSDPDQLTRTKRLVSVLTIRLSSPNLYKLMGLNKKETERSDQLTVWFVLHTE